MITLKDGSQEWITCSEELERILDEKLGRDVAELFRHYLNVAENNSETDSIYSIEEHYQSQLHDIVDAIDEMLSSSRIDRKKLQLLRNNIWKEL